MPESISPTIEELAERGVERYTADGNFTATRVLRCMWGHRHVLARSLIGGARADTNGRAVIRLGQRHPFLPKARVNDVAIEGVGKSSAHNGNTGIIAFDYAELTVSYGVGQYTNDDDEVADPELLVTENIEPACEFMALPTRGAQYDDPSESGTEYMPIPPEAALSMLLVTCDWVVTQHAVFSLPTNMLSLVGGVNKDPIYSSALNHTFDAGTLLVNPPRASRKITSDGAGLWELTSRFTYRPQGWNCFRHPDGSWVPLVDPATGNEITVYAEVDAKLLLPLGMYTPPTPPPEE